MTDRHGHYVHEPLDGGVDLFVWSTGKFKSRSIRIALVEPLDERTTGRALLASLLRRGCRSFPDQMSLARRLEFLYGSALALDVSKLGERYLSLVRLRVVDERYLPSGAGVLQPGLDLAREILTEPVTDDDGFPADVFEQERVNLIHGIRSLIDDKGAYAYQRLVEESYPGEPYARFEWGNEDEAAALDRVELLRDHRERLRRAPLEVFAVGRFESQDLDELRRFTNDLTRREPSPPPKAAGAAAETVVKREVVEELPVAQSRVLIGARFDASRLDDRDWYALSLFNLVLGGGSFSKLFKEVREHRSLAYDASSSLDRAQGFLVLQAGVSAANWRAAADVMREQLACMRNGAISGEELELARAAAKDSFNGVNDDAARSMEFASIARLVGRSADVPSIIDALDAVTKEDLVRVAALPEEGVTYALQGVET